MSLFGKIRGIAIWAMQTVVNHKQIRGDKWEVSLQQVLGGNWGGCDGSSSAAGGGKLIVAGSEGNLSSCWGL